MIYIVGETGFESKMDFNVFTTNETALPEIEFVHKFLPWNIDLDRGLEIT